MSALQHTRWWGLVALPILLVLAWTPTWGHTNPAPTPPTGPVEIPLPVDVQIIAIITEFTDGQGHLFVTVASLSGTSIVAAPSCPVAAPNATSVTPVGTPVAIRIPLDGSAIAVVQPYTDSQGHGYVVIAGFGGNSIVAAPCPALPANTAASAR
jgi:hypothetical protein